MPQIPVCCLVHLLRSLEKKSNTVRCFRPQRNCRGALEELDLSMTDIKVKTELPVSYSSIFKV